MANLLTPLPNDGTRRPRLEIDEFIGDNEVTNLFLVAFAELQANSAMLVDGKPNWMKFYSIAGIHGQPIESWAGHGDKPFRGYCRHGSTTFPTWHRPYMFLLEIALYQEMKRQASKYPTDALRKVYAAAAERFRLPFWDIVMPRYKRTSGSKLETIWGCPAILNAPKVYVKKPVPVKPDANGFDQINNPLYSFVFPEASDLKKAGRPTLGGMDSSLFNTTQTSRIADASGNTQVNLLDLAIQRQASARATSIWQMLNPDLTAGDLGKNVAGPAAATKVLDSRTWEQFANRDAGNSVSVAGTRLTVVSLESWHDGIHVLMGTGQYYDGLSSQTRLPENKSPKQGQMGDPAWAAFDPIFFLHHCNIDRLLAIYQALWPRNYVAAGNDDVPLYPFKQNDSSDGFYKSTDAYIHNYWNAGFAIPGNAPPDAKATTSAIQKELKKYLTSTYYWATNNATTGDPLANWPKDKERQASWALNGSAAVVPDVQQPTIQLNALEFVQSQPHFLSREISLPSNVSGDLSVEFKDTTVDTSQILESAATVNSLLPEGAFTAPLTAELPALQFTWNASIKIRKFAFDGSFSVHVFLGYVKDHQPERYMTKKNEVGFTGVFAMSPDFVENCPNCVQQRDNDIIVDDVVPLTTMLYDYLDAAPGSENLIRDGDHTTIPDLTPESVVPFLKEQLQWRIIDLGANLLAGQEEQAGLVVTVTSRQFMPPTPDNLMGVYGPETVHAEITSNKAGGYGYTY